jgi:hypothetical protein
MPLLSSPGNASARQSPPLRAPASSSFDPRGLAEQKHVLYSNLFQTLFHIRAVMCQSQRANTLHFTRLRQGITKSRCHIRLESAMFPIDNF